MNESGQGSKGWLSGDYGVREHVGASELINVVERAACVMSLHSQGVLGAAFVIAAGGLSPVCLASLALLLLVAVFGVVHILFGIYPVSMVCKIREEHVRFSAA